jgi:hypothetical protein
MTANQKPAITRELRVAELLKHYPDLEDILIGISPAFSKLKNPVLRKTVAKVATLKQASLVGDVPISEMINRLRQAAGIEDMLDEMIPNRDSMAQKPDWVNQNEKIITFDIVELIEKGQQPITDVVQRLNRLSGGEVLEVLTPFFPAPLIDKAHKLGYESWSEKVNDKLTRNYFRKKH